MGRRKRFEEVALARFAAGTFSRIADTLRAGESRMDFLRTAVDSELASRERKETFMARAEIVKPSPEQAGAPQAACEKRCETCAWFDPDFVPAEHCVDPEDAMGLCEWPANQLPFSLRYGNRERLAVAPKDGAQCAQWKEKSAAAPEAEAPR